LRMQTVLNIIMWMHDSEVMGDHWEVMTHQ